MKKDNDTIKVSSESKLQLPLANIDHLKEQVDVINKQIDKLRNGTHQ
jgi:hypothetical protein